MKNIKIKYILIALLPIQYFAFKIIASKDFWVEKYYIPYVFKPITLVFRKILGGIDFSIGLFLIYILVFYLVFLLVKKVFFKPKKVFNFKIFCLNTFSNISIFYLIYMLLWGLAYHRQPIEKLMNLNIENIQKKELIALTNKLILKTNALRKNISEKEIDNISLDLIIKKAPLGYSNLSAKNQIFTYNQKSVKKVFGSNILSYLSTAGIYIPFSGEANVNIHNTNASFPFTISHEMAHQLGFAKEDEANFIAFMASNSEPSNLFKYSANYSALWYAINNVAAYDEPLAWELKQKIDPKVLADREKEKNIYNQYKIKWLQMVSSSIYDLFLKANNEEAGIESYSQMVNLLIGLERKNELLK